ncbi:MAG: RNA polymerase sigma factor [Acidobacteriota bacterium]
MSHRKLPPARPELAAEMQQWTQLRRSRDIGTFRDRHLLPLFRLARVLVGDDAGAVSLAIDVFDTALDNSGSWPREKPLGSWLHAQLVATWLRRERRAGTPVAAPAPGPAARTVRTRRRRRRGGQNPPPVSAGAAPGKSPDLDLTFDENGCLSQDNVLDWSVQPVEDVAHSNLALVIEAAGRRLPPRLRLAWALCDVCGQTLSTAGDILDLSDSIVRARLHQARLRLRAALTRHVRSAPPGPGEGDGSGT